MQYKILLPNKRNATLEFAARELGEFSAPVLGVLPVETEPATPCHSASPCHFDRSGEIPAQTRCISLGDTALLKAAGLSAGADFGNDGYAIKAAGGNLFIFAAGDYGVLYGVYGFLERFCGVKFFADDEIAVTPADSCLNKSGGAGGAFDGIDVVSVPSFAVRARAWMGWSKYNQEYVLRLCLNTGTGPNWITKEHSFFAILPKEKYFAAHPEFYNKNGTQLCLTNEGMRAQMVENITGLARQAVGETARGGSVFYIMVGHEDNHDFCACESCSASDAEYGGASGTMMRLVNAVAGGAGDALGVFYPDVTFKFVTFAYGPTIDAPVRGQSGGLVPVHPSVRAGKNVGVYLAPLGSDWAKSLLDAEYNKTACDSLLGWRAVGAELYVWNYDSVFDEEFVFFNGWKHMADNYRVFKEFGAVYVYDMGHPHQNMPFDKLSNYVRSRLMWDVSLDAEELIRGFMDAYYGEAAGEIARYFYKMRDKLDGAGFALRSYVRKTPEYLSDKFFTRGFLEDCLAIFDRAFRAANRVCDPARREKLLRRVGCERLSPLYLYLLLYARELDAPRLKALIDEFERGCLENGIYYFAEHGPMAFLDVGTRLMEFRTFLYE